ncbi:MAG TPA: efflux RND transporter periplasmic adaptor subunit [Steroidobacteraceae bacterium]|nr:efflux RND transporter periplasmic adaptor subunit [Steroidobacteraceae bacterium]
MQPKPFLVLLAASLLLTACGGGKPAAGDAATAPQEASATRVALSAEQLKTAGIGVATAGPAQIREVLPLYGVVAPNAEHVREVAARFPGVIRSVERKLGDAVKQGDVLANVESNESLQVYAVRSPISGVISSRNANAGEQTGDKPLFVVMDLSTVWVELSLFARDVAKVRVGQSVQVKSPVAEFSAQGRVTYVGPFGNSNQALTARVEVPNPEHRWAPGLYVTGEVTLAQHEAALAVQSSAIQMIEDRPVVFVQAGGNFSAHRVALGKTDGERTEVLQGVAVGDVYASANSYVIKAELRKSEAAED